MYECSFEKSGLFALKKTGIVPQGSSPIKKNDLAVLKK